MNNHKDQKILLNIETEEFDLYIKGIPYNHRYESIKQYRKFVSYEDETMELNYTGNSVKSFSVYDVRTDRLQPYHQRPFFPIFFENGIYQIVIVPKSERLPEFYHEHIGMREAVGPVGNDDRQLLMGQLDFTNEVGLSTFSIQFDGKNVLTVTIEIFPSKLSYKKDYEQLLKEVNDEIYNLSFHFIKKTCKMGGIQASERSTPSEFFRLLEHYIHPFMNAIRQIEKRPHHQLTKEYVWVRADRVKKQDSYIRNYFIKHPQLFKRFIDKKSGKELQLPSKGHTIKKKITLDNFENRFVKWMIIRIVNKLDDLLNRINQIHTRFSNIKDKELVERIRSTKARLIQTLKNPFWAQIGKLDRSVMNLVIQTKAGYRDTYKIYLILMKGISLQGEIVKMSLKDVATLYEYWTYLKMAQILRKQFVLETQDVVNLKHGTLFVRLDETRNSRQVFLHPHTGERIVLSYQKSIFNLPTVSQRPDIFLEIQKKGVDYTYNYAFDAKYRIQFDNGNGDDFLQPGPGPMEEDINTMHRYRDALVAKSGGPYERHAFGAYVLFPWHDEDNYENHPFYKSIEEVNIGGIPFLPNANKLLERLLDRLINSNPEELQEEGILPKGSISYWQSKIEENVLVLTVNDPKKYVEIKKNRKVYIPLSLLKTGWEKSRYVALYVVQNVANHLNVPNGIQFFSPIHHAEIKTDQQDLHVIFSLGTWNLLPQTIKPVGYGIQSNIITTLSILKQSKELPELFMKFGEEVKLWRMLRRFTSNVTTLLDSNFLDQAKKIQAYQIGFYSVDIDMVNEEIHIHYNNETIRKIPLEKLHKEPTFVFKQLRDVIFKH
ncbi:restriction endonuclease-like protein [Fervidibacillus albus]|uniref:Restriction endonuclease-like protein n=1 Tax=Fervidibacillus albus TaxID=2980026 RepID=A0A9E8LWY4_9BACI|nr:restriction endonuclease-like protein [Fervidibacillus albus]WAA10987.1 restriction endonuclease-like protein [Fervidibacillus albus]